MALTRDQILQAEDLTKIEVQVPEWKGSVWVRMLTGKERDELESFWDSAKKKGEFTDARATVASLTICDERGERLFSDKDIQVLGQKSSAALQRVFDEALKLNRLTKDDVKELAGN